MEAAYQCSYPIENLKKSDYEDKIKEIQTDPYQRDLLTELSTTLIWTVL